MKVAVCCKGVPVDAPLGSVQIANGDIQYKDTNLTIEQIL